MPKRLSGGNWKQDSRLVSREERRADFSARPLGARITGVDTHNERLRTISPVGEPDFPINQPFLSANAWHRAIPESGDGLLITQRHDSGRYQAIAYDKQRTSDRIDLYMSGFGVYRPLRPGEQDLYSYGIAGMYLSRDGVLELRGGSVYGELNHTTLQSWMKAPLHRRLLHLHKETSLGDEERLGYVFRPLPPDYGISPIKKNELYHAKEHYLHLQYTPTTGVGAGTLPNIDIARTRLGNVYNALGLEELHSVTSLPLRYLAEYWDLAGAQKLTVEVDEVGNVAATLPPTAAEGMRVKIPVGQFQMDVMQAFKVNSTGPITVDGKADATYNSVGDATLSSMANVKVNAKVNIVSEATVKMEDKSPLIEQTASAKWTVKTPLGNLDAQMLNLGDSKVPMGLVVTTVTHPTDYITGLPILGSAIVRAASIPSVG